MPDNIEIRTYPGMKWELRSEDSSPQEGKLRGHAAVFNEWGGDPEYFMESIAPGAFSKTLDEDIRALWNHNDMYVLGRNKSGTLFLKEDERGLYVEIDPPNAQWAKDFMESVNRGDVDQMSFRFIVVKDDWEMRDDVAMRTIKEVRLLEVSPVTFPFYEGTDIALRSKDLAFKKQTPEQFVNPEVRSIIAKYPQLMAGVLNINGGNKDE